MYLSCDRGHVGQGTFGSLSTIEGINTTWKFAERSFFYTLNTEFDRMTTLEADPVIIPDEASIASALAIKARLT